VQLDRTQIVIRARSMTEIGDLAMMVIHRFPAATIFGSLLGALPWAIANALLIGWIPIREFAESLQDYQTQFEISRYTFLMIALVTLQAPIAGALTTIWVGRAVFEPRVSLRAAWQDLKRSGWRLVWTLGVIRGPLPLMMILASGWGQPFNWVREVLLPLGFLMWAGFIRGRRPFLPEILLLERCPLRSRDPGTITLRRRNAALHDPLTSELIGRFMLVSLTLTAIGLGFYYAIVWFRGVMFGHWEASPLVQLVLFPLALWAVAGLSVLVRFLSYLDSRIRLEGWEVDLAVRAEAERLAGADERAGLVVGTTPPKVGGLGGVGVLSGVGDGPSGQTAIVASSLAPRIGLSGWIALILGAGFAASPPAHAASRTAVGLTNGVAVAVADDAGSVPLALPPDSNWFDRSAGRVVPIDLRTREVDNANRRSDWEDKPQPWNMSGPNVSFDFPLLRVIGWVGLVLAIFIAVAVLLFLYSRFEPTVLGGKTESDPQQAWAKDDQTQRRMEQLPAEIRVESLDPRSEAERLMRLGRLDGAIAALFAHQLILLDRCGWLRLSRGKTNQRYLGETRVHSATGQELLAQTVMAFEASYFGKLPPTAERFARLWADNAKLEAAANRAREAVA
jgi:hypothetical protein